jgi:hypothetical protein
MTAAGLATTSELTDAPDTGRPQQTGQPPLIEVLDLQENEVPDTADALRHFFGDA